MTVHEQKSREMAQRCAKHFVWPSGTTHTKESAIEIILSELNLVALLDAQRQAALYNADTMRVMEQRDQLKRELEEAKVKHDSFQKAVTDNIGSCTACASQIFTGGVWPECSPHTCAIADRDQWQQMAQELAVALRNHPNGRYLTGEEVLTRFNELNK